MSEYARSGERILRGIPVSGGVRRGKIVVLGNGREAVPHYEVPAGEMAQEIQRLEQALTRTREGILDVQRKVSNAMGAKDASIFDAHLLVLEDPMLIDEVTRLIKEQKLNAEFDFHQVAENYGATLSSMDDEYLRERAADLRRSEERRVGKESRAGSAT